MLPLLLPSSEPCSELKIGATWRTPQSPPRLLPWSFTIFAAVVRSDVAVVDVGAIGLLTILRVDGDASGVDENGAAFVARKGVVDVVEVDADLGLVSDAIDVVEVDSTRAVVDEAVDVVVAGAISVVAGDAEGAAALGAISAAAEAVGVVEADAIFSAVEDAVAAVAADAISAAGGGVVGAAAADAGATTARGAMAVDRSTPQLSTK